MSWLNDVEAIGTPEMAPTWLPLETRRVTALMKLFADCTMPTTSPHGLKPQKAPVPVSVSLTGETTNGTNFLGTDTLDLFLSGRALRDLLEELAAAGLI